MILNVPTPDDLNAVARRLYFSAWIQLIDIQNSLNSYTLHVSQYSDDDAEIQSGSKEYLKRSQPDLQSIFVIVQQSNELALKARVCEVSPYLLLLKNDGKLKLKPSDIDFSELRTLDATDLPGAVNSFSSKHLSETYINSYALLRKRRNKISHLGFQLGEFEPDHLFRMLTLQWVEFWGDRHWLADRAEFEEQNRDSLFHDYKYNSPMMIVMQELPLTIQSMTGKEFKNVFGHSKKALSYLCHSCFEYGNTRYAGLEIAHAKTGVFLKEISEVKCLICQRSHKVKTQKCKNDLCKHSLLSSEAEYFERCHSCGERN